MKISVIFGNSFFLRIIIMKCQQKYFSSDSLMVGKSR